jgi:hypothetical protein
MMPVNNLCHLPQDAGGADNHEHGLQSFMPAPPNPRLLLARPTPVIRETKQAITGKAGKSKEQRQENKHEQKTPAEDGAIQKQCRHHTGKCEAKQPPFFTRGHGTLNCDYTTARRPAGTAVITDGPGWHGLMKTETQIFIKDYQRKWSASPK